MTIQVDHILDAKGLACPMPIVKTKQKMEKLLPGHVLEVQATDKGSIADIQSWAARTGHAYLGTLTNEDVIHHYLQKANPSEVKLEQQYPITLTNDELQAKLEQADNNVILIDVREPAEFAFGHFPGELSIPLGMLKENIETLDYSSSIYVICRTGNRSDAAAQLLTANGLKKVTNIIPGMSEWTGPVTRNKE